MTKVCKFGGTSMADGTTMQRIKNILESDSSRRYIVVSAPGKRFSADIKVTDLLYSVYQNVVTTGSVGAEYESVCERFKSIVYELGLDIDYNGILNETKERILEEKSEEFTASRGEYLSGLFMAKFLNVPFVDAEQTIRFTKEGKLDEKTTYGLLKEALQDKERAVIAGFYGADEEGRVHTFSRGGSDITGAVVARAVGADLYENWTDVSGFLICDPRIIENSKPIRSLSYKELRELSYMGANVLHSESIFPVREADIPIRIKNTFAPEDAGTEILPSSKYRMGRQTVTGIAGKKNFCVVYVEKSLMNSEIGFARKILSVFEKHNISFEHMPSGIDTMSFVVEGTALSGEKREIVLSDIQAAVCPDRLSVIDDIALIAVVGHGMSRNVGTSARVFSAIARAGVNVRMIDQGSSELNIIIGVDNENFERTLRAVYNEFFH